MKPQTQDVDTTVSTAPSVEVENQPSVSEDVTNPGEQQGKVAEGSQNQIPLERFQEVNEAKKQAEERAAQAEEARAKLEKELESARPKQDSNEEEIDPEVEKLIGAYAKKHGLLTRQELEAQRVQDQVRSDVKDLQTKYASSGVPFDDKAVFKYAQDNGVSITSRSSLEAVYRQMNFDKLIVAERQRAIDSYKNNPNGTEKPGSSPSETPNESDKKMSPAERKAARFRAVREKLNLAS